MNGEVCKWIGTEAHLNPYKISWNKKGGEAIVNEISSVPLSIGNHYKDQIICDVVDMDVCHILLGRPWQCDNQAIHQSRVNTYEFMWLGKKIVLLPLGQNEGKKHPKTQSQLFTLIHRTNFLKIKDPLW